MIDIIYMLLKGSYGIKPTLSQTYRLMHIFAVNSSSTIFSDARISFKDFLEILLRKYSYCKTGTNQILITHSQIHQFRAKNDNDK